MSTKQQSTESGLETPADVLVLGGGHFGRIVAEDLAETDREVAFVDEQESAVEKTQRAAVALSDPMDPDGLAELVPDITTADLVIVLTGSDSKNFLVAKLLQSRLGVEHLAVGVSDPNNHEPISAAGVETICLPSWTARAIRHSIIDAG